jgi:hypothetical protein
VNSVTTKTGAVRYFLNGKEVTREEFNADQKPFDFSSAPMTSNTYRAHDPLISEGLGCMRDQVPEMREVIKQHNIQGVTVRDNGQLEITSRRGRRELLRVRGLADADAGYSD